MQKIISFLMAVGLYLLVKKNGGKYWRYKYRFYKKEKLLAIGVYPIISLKEAREKHIAAKRLLADNIDPNEHKQTQYAETIGKLENTFEIIALEWWETNREMWSEHHAKRIKKSLERDAFPYIGSRPLVDVTSPELLAVIRRVESRDALDIASRLLQRCNAIFRYAVQIGKTKHNPGQDLIGVVKTRKVKHQASLSREELPKFLKKMDQYDGSPITTSALNLLVYTFVRPGELRGARWEEFDMQRKEWRIPAERMKMKTPHIVPLSKPVIKQLNQLRPLTGQYELLFPSERSRKKSMSENTLTYAIYRLA